LAQWPDVFLIDAAMGFNGIVSMIKNRKNMKIHIILLALRKCTDFAIFR
jgi:hypothetical protein